MKKTFRFAMLACLMMLSSACRAQKAVPAIDQAFDNFVQNLIQEDYIVSSTASTYNVGTMKCYEFMMPDKKQKLVDAFNKVLQSNSVRAYDSFMKKAGSNSTNTQRIGYGDDNNRTYEFGTHKERNYNVQLFRDPKDSTMRYAYALVWYPAKGDNVMGSVYKLHSKNPRTYKRSSTYTSTTVNNDGTVSTSTTVIDSDGAVHRYRSGATGLQGLDSLVALGKNIKFSKSLARSYEPEMTPPKDAAEFMVQLNSLRAAFKNASEQVNRVTRRTLQTGVANKIVKLCKGYSKLLNADEKKFCATALTKMKKDTDDEYLQSLLELTAKGMAK